MSRNIVKILDKGFSDISAGEKMLISSPEKISEFIFTIPKGSYLSIKELRRGLALKAGADNTCPVTTGYFPRVTCLRRPSSGLVYAKKKLFAPDGAITTPNPRNTD